MNIIIYIDKNCNYCKEQLRIVKKNKIKAIIKDSSDMPEVLKGKNGSVTVPKVMFVHTGIIDFGKIKNNIIKKKKNIIKKKKNIIKKKNNIIKTKVKKNNIIKKNNFGVSEISLRQYGKNYIPELKTGGYTGSVGTFGRDVNYDNNIIFSKGYNNNIRMGRPGGPEDFVNLNYNCNVLNGKNNNSEYGMYSDSSGPFKFGSMTDYGGGKNNNNNKNNNEYPMIKNNTFIGGGIPNYFGRKVMKKKKIIKEGSVLTLKRKKNGKSKIKVKS
jgi:hypothetical protein